MQKLLELLKPGVWLAALLIISMAACDDDDEGDVGGGDPQLTGNSETYTLFSQSDPAINGTVEFAERDDGVTIVTINLNGTPDGGSHPAHIHANTAAEGGGIEISLTNVDGSTGESVTEISQDDDGNPISYSELINFDGYVNVHLSPTDLATLVAQGDIGQNALTTNTVTYDLASVSDPSISGTATFTERNNGNTLIDIQLTGTPAGGDHPAHVHENDAATGGGIVISLTNVNGDTGQSLTSVSQLDDGTAVTYNDLIAFDGHINVHLSSDDLATLVAQGDIGSNSN